MNIEHRTSNTEHRNLDNSLRNELSSLEADGHLRYLRSLGSRSGKWIDYEGRRMLNLCSNDYMSYALDESLVKEFYAQLEDVNIVEDFGPGSSASRLLSGNHSGYTRLEETIESLYGRPAVVFSSGYHANIGILSTLAGREDLILSDKYAHASIIDGVRLAAADQQRYPHMDMSQLEKILSEKRSAYRRVFVATESIFSMDGDTADLAKLVELKKKYDIVLYVDEAHAVGACGEKGLGIAEEQGVIGQIDILIGTFGKALGGMGSFAVCSKTVKEYLVNKSRSLIFTTALPPVAVHWNNWILKRMSDDREKRRRLRDLANDFRSRLTEMGLDTRGDSHIVPLIIGDNQAAVDAAERLNEKGFMVFAVRPPTVPPNTARLRFSLTAGMTEEDLDGILEIQRKDVVRI